MSKQNGSIYIFSSALGWGDTFSSHGRPLSTPECAAIKSDLFFLLSKTSQRFTVFFLPFRWILIKAHTAYTHLARFLKLYFFPQLENMFKYLAPIFTAVWHL